MHMIKNSKHSLILANKIKNTISDSEVLPLVLYYIMEGTVISQKRAIPHLHECLLFFYSQVRKQREDELAVVDTEDTNQTVASGKIFKGRKFSNFYSGSYLLFKTYEYLFDQGINELIPPFLQASVQEIKLELKTTKRQDLIKNNLKTYCLLWRILNVTGAAKELQDHIFRYILICPTQNLNDALVKISFIKSVYHAKESIDSHIEFIVASYGVEGFVLPEDIQDQQKTAEYIINVLYNKETRTFLNSLPEFKEYIDERFKDPEGTEQVCPSKFYRRYFPKNTLGCMPHVYEEIQMKYFDEHIESHLNTWIGSSTTTHSNININFNDAQSLKTLVNDFYLSANRHVKLIEAGHKDKDLLDFAGPKMSILNAVNLNEDAIGRADVKEFIDYVKSNNLIRRFKNTEVNMNVEENLASDLMKMEGISLYEGIILLNQQKCFIFKIEVKHVDQLKVIKENLFFMQIYSPFIVKYIGIYFSDEMKGNSLELYFVTEWWKSDLFSYFENTLNVSSLKSLHIDQLVFIYRCSYLLYSLKRSQIAPPWITPSHIFIGSNGYPMFLFLFFSQSYISSKAYLKALFKQEEISTEHYFAYPFFESMPDSGQLLHHMRSKKSYKLSAVFQTEGTMKVLEDAGSYSFKRVCFYLLSGLMPLQQTKPITAEAFKNLLSSPEKQAPLMNKLVAEIKRRATPQTKPSLEKIVAILQKDSVNWKEIVDILSQTLPLHYLINTKIEYNIDILENAAYMQTEGVHIFESGMKKAVFLPSNLIFTGYLSNRRMDSAKFFLGSNLQCSFTFDPKDQNTYKCDYYFNDSKSILAQIDKGRVSLIQLYVKAKQTTDEKGGEAKTIDFPDFFDHSWVPDESMWMNAVQQFTRIDPQESRMN